MIRDLIALCLATGMAMPALADSHAMAPSGDAAAGEKGFSKCKACHSIVSTEGEEIAKGGKVGPNLFGVPGRQAGSVEGFRYSDSMVAAGDAGLMWNETDFAVYVQDPTAFLKEYLGDPKARGKMTFKLRDGSEAADIWAYLVTVSPEAPPPTQ